MEARPEIREAGAGKREPNSRRRRWMPAAASKMRQARRLAFVLGAIAAIALAVAVFAGFRDSTNAHPAVAAAIHATGVVASANTEAADPPPNDDFDNPGYFPTPFTFPGNSFS